MNSTLKRALSRDEGSISPPSTKRKLEEVEPALRPLLCPSENHVRIFSWNVNGIGPFLQRPISFSNTTSFRSPLRDFLARHDWPHILCLQEVKINPKDTATQRALQHAANLEKKNSKNEQPSASTNPTYTVHFSLPRDKYNATGFGGKVHGIATLIRDDLSQSLTIPTLTTTTRTVPWDLEGRVLITTLTIPSPSPNPTSTTLNIIHAYWPNGTTLPYHSPLTGSPQGTRHDHKLRFHAHILSDALSLQSQSQSHQVLLIGDMNIAPARPDGHPNLRITPDQHVLNRADFNTKFLDQGNKEGFGGVDVWRYLRGGERKYTYHPRRGSWGASCDRVDLVIAGRGFVSGDRGDGQGEGGKGEDPAQEPGRAKGALANTEIHDNELDRGHSDHVPLSVTLDLSKLRPA